MGCSRGRERNSLFPSEGNQVQDENFCGQKQSCHLALVQRNAEEAQCASVVHGSSRDVEREASDRGVHQNPEVVAQVGAGYTERPHTGQDQDVANSEEDVGEQWLVKGSVVGLVIQGLIVQVVSKDSQTKDGDCEKVAAIVGAPEDASQVALVVLW